MPVPQRRTQRERREGTIRKLLDAATDTLIERGYAEASVQRICERAEVSQGALFRHFASREALMVAVAEDIADQLLARYRRKFLALDRADRADLEAALRLVREACRSQLNQAWYELAMAARTNANLRKALEPMAERYFDAIARLARELLPELAAALGDTFDVLVGTVLAVFDGEVGQRYVIRQPKLEEARIDLLVGAVTSLVAQRARR
ncbi:MAG TPA: helix-turn-helix domain-containing protein [Kofleriaceae bacterium]|nr:helix-turn-helix domain-containing protein [Kofleriaceae bacterium]